MSENTENSIQEAMYTEIRDKSLFDQAQRYADVQFKDVAFYREDIEKRAERKYHPGNQKP